MQPYHENLVHYNWHWFWDFGNGELGNNGIHLVDISRWGMKKRLPSRIYSTGGRFGYKDQAQTPNTQNITWVYDDGSSITAEMRGLYTSEPMSWDFFGTKGHMHIFADGKFQIVMGRNKQPEPEVEPLPNVEHMKNFTDAVRSRDWTSLNAEIGDASVDRALPLRQHFLPAGPRATFRLLAEPVHQRSGGRQVTDSRVSQAVRGSRQGLGVMINRRVFLQSLGAGGLLPAQARADRPNIVYVLCDDLGWGDLRCYNRDSLIPTPHADRLASQGVRFTDMHSPSSVCTPTRYGILTGRYCWRTPLKSGVLRDTRRT